MNVSTTTAVTMGACRYCGTTPGHSTERCPQVKAVEYRKDGTIARIEKVTPGDYAAPLAIRPQVFPPEPQWPTPDQWRYNPGPISGTGSITADPPGTYTVINGVLIGAN